jgi:hypothetical protein
LLGGGGAVVTGDQDVDFAADLAGGGDGVQGAALRAALSCSAMTRMVMPAPLDHLGFVLEFATSSATSATLTPALRLGGSRP